MSTFSYSIQTAFIFFPIVALIFTLPYLLYQYHKYGSVNVIRSIIVYSFLLYLMSAYFLVILPLPSIESVSQMTTPQYNLIPFQFIIDIFSNTSFQFSDFATYFPTLKNPVFYESFFNLLLTVPLGVYLHYYFQCDFKKTAFYSFCLSLFFELTQLTGLYFIYPRGYRVFDIDDLILNTLGGLLGFLIAFILLKFLPSRKEIDEKSIKKGSQVSCFKRLFCFIFDWFLVLLFLFCSLVLMKNFNIYSHLLFSSFSIFIIFIYFIIIPCLNQKQTVGMEYFHLQFVSDKKVSFLRIFLYYFLMLFEYIILPILFFILGIYLYQINVLSRNFFEYYCIIVFAFELMIYIISILKVAFHMETIFEKISKIDIESTIKVS